MTLFDVLFLLSLLSIVLLAFLDEEKFLAAVHFLFGQDGLDYCKSEQSKLATIVTGKQK